jgi:hypothetical protein
MLNTLILTLDYYYKACKRAIDLPTQRTFFDQAFGAAQYHIMMFPNDQKKVESLWDDYKSQFEKIIYGWG